MQKKKKAETEESYKKYFPSFQSSSSKVFPIDFSLREFDQNHKGNFDRARNVVEHPFLCDVLINLIWEDDVTAKSVLGYGGKYPLPVEAETFLRCFYDLIEKDEFHTTPKKRKN